MYPPRTRKGSSISELLGYTLPKLHTGKSWYVDFCAYDPASQRMKRKKYMLDGIRKLSERRSRAAEIIATVACRLQEGWNPWAEVSSSRQYTKMITAIDLYTAYVGKLYETSAIKESTYLDYNKRIRVLSNYISNHAQPIQYVFEFNLAFISDFLDYIIMDREASARTRNNYKVWLSSFCGWMVEKQYLQNNPCEHIKALKEEPKKREALTAAHLKRLSKHLKENDPYFLLACQMEYYTFIRPEELTNIRIKDIHLKDQKVFIGGEIAKNRKDAMVGLNDELIKMMLDLGVFAHDGGSYLFSTRFRPGKKKLSTKVIRSHFYKVRDELHLPKTYLFYSLKDSGIRDLANAEGIVVARDQARHADVSTTNKYLKGNALTVHEETKHFKGNL